MMNEKEYRYKKLTPKENQIIDEFQQSLPDKPVNIVGLANRFGITTYQAEFPPGISGSIMKEEEGYCIYADNSDPVTRRRFTYAHELAHFLLHKDDIGEGIRENVLFRSNLSNEKEVQANKIAADILMPTEKLNELAPKIQNVEALAKIFKVSRSALLTRLGIPELPNYSARA